MVPLVDKSKPGIEKKFEHEKFAAVFVMHEPHNWMDGLQVISDVLLSDGLVTESGYTRASEQVVKLFVANPDFSYSAAFNQPRMTAGAFISCLATIYKQYCGRDLQSTVYGKPGIEYFAYAETILRQAAAKAGGDSKLSTIYMIGDNPKSDIQGANNAGDQWYSILVRTGLFKGENDASFPAKHVADTVYDAIQFILQREGLADRTAS